MRRRGMLVILIFVLSFYSGSVCGGFEGNSNTFYGTNAGLNTTGDNDGVTFMGAGAGYNNTGPYNTFIGRSAGVSNADGHYNTFVGYGAGYSNTTAYSNSFFGYQAGYSTTEGGFNTFIGFSAGYKNTGINNVFVGYAAGHENTSGGDNTYLGSWAGYKNTTGNGNVFLGENAGYNETGSNKLYIGSSYSGPPLIYGEFDNPLLVINGVLSIASSQEYKERIVQLKPEKAMDILQHLNPVEFSYKATPIERHLGFISEEVPEPLTARERKAVSPMDIVAVLTKVVQEQQKTISTLREELNELKGKVR
jgi:hypothetical protein